MKIAIEKFWCVKYYKAQPYNMEHTLCVCNNPGFKEIWDKNIPIEAISTRRQKQIFGIINPSFLQQD